MTSPVSFLTDDQFDALLANGQAAHACEAAQQDFDPPPVVKLFTPDAGATWLLSQLDPQEPDLAFGLCDLGMGFPEIGIVRLSSLAEVRGMMSRPIARDVHFSGHATPERLRAGGPGGRAHPGLRVAPPARPAALNL